MRSLNHANPARSRALGTAPLARPHDAFIQEGRGRRGPVSCAIDPYWKREVPNPQSQQSADTVKKTFAYGQFCGPDYPITSSTPKLTDFWPPLDDLDTICHAVALKQAKSMNALGCFYLAHTLIESFKKAYRSAALNEAHEDVAIDTPHAPHVALAEAKPSQ